MQHKSIKEITVKELVEEVDINRSTFYLHYTDIYNMLETIENDLQEEILKIIQEHPVSPFNEASFPFIEDIFLILWENKDICSALLGPNGDMSFVSRIESIISEHSLKVLKATFPENMDSLKYSYSFCLTGCIGLDRNLAGLRHRRIPQHMADLTFRLDHERPERHLPQTITRRSLPQALSDCTGKTNNFSAQQKPACRPPYESPCSPNCIIHPYRIRQAGPVSSFKHRKNHQLLAVLPNQSSLSAT
ncbi:TetR family transcriptional regulator C-terminal domain-containing protein [Blautia sp. RD014234]|nr:TetR family transcriptional regulator C-terminal domain-containing protein [Blautia parvula]